MHAGLDGSHGNGAARVYCSCQSSFISPWLAVIILCLRSPGKAGGCQMENPELRSHDID
jgi:hypothetical protein